MSTINSSTVFASIIRLALIINSLEQKSHGKPTKVGEEADLDNNYSQALLSSHGSLTSKISSCRLQSMRVSLHTVDDTILSPREADIKICVGTCSDIGSSERFHIMNQSLMRPPKACCILPIRICLCTISTRLPGQDPLRY